MANHDAWLTYARQQIRTKRLELGLTQSQAGAKIGMTQSDWAKYEGGNKNERTPGVTKLYQMCSAVDLTIHDVLPPTID